MYLHSEHMWKWPLMGCCNNNYNCEQKSASGHLNEKTKSCFSLLFQLRPIHNQLIRWQSPLSHTCWHKGHVCNVWLLACIALQDQEQCLIRIVLYHEFISKCA